MQSSANADVIAVAIAGCSCSGKSTVVREMVALDNHSLVVHQDKYYQPVAPLTDDGLENWDAMGALNTDKLVEDVKAVVRDPFQYCPTCQTAARRSKDHTRHVVYIEGTMILDISMLSELLHLKIFITLTYEECLKRRQRRYNDYIDPPGFFNSCVWPMYMKRESLSIQDPSIHVINGQHDKEEILGMINTIVKKFKI